MLLPTEARVEDLETTKNVKEKLGLLLIAAASLEVTTSKKTQQESNRRNNFDAGLHQKYAFFLHLFILVRFLPLVIDHNHGYKSLPW